MQQRPNAAPSAGFNFVLAAVLGFIGLYDIVSGFTRDGAGVFITGLALYVFGVLVKRVPEMAQFFS